MIGVLSFLLYLRDRKQGLYLWLALYLVAGGLHGLQGLSAFRFGMTWHTYQLLTQLLSSAQDISMWLILLSLFGMVHERQWRRATGWIVAAYLAAQVIDITTIWFWEKGGILPWIDGITTGVYSITPSICFRHHRLWLDAPKSAFAMAFDCSCLCQRPFFLSSKTWLHRAYDLPTGPRLPVCRTSEFTRRLFL